MTLAGKKCKSLEEALSNCSGISSHVHRTCLDGRGKNLSHIFTLSLYVTMVTGKQAQVDSGWDTGLPHLHLKAREQDNPAPSLGLLGTRLASIPVHFTRASRDYISPPTRNGENLDQTRHRQTPEQERSRAVPAKHPSVEPAGERQPRVLACCIGPARRASTGLGLLGRIGRGHSGALCG